MNTLSPTPYGFTNRPSSSWTTLSLALAVSWMLSLAFGTSTPPSSETYAPQSDRVYKILEVGLLTGLRAVVHQAASPNRGGSAETQAPSSDG